LDPASASKLDCGHERGSSSLFSKVIRQLHGNDSTMMRGKFKIARWFAPGQKGSNK
jgi:hypothetical protein